MAREKKPRRRYSLCTDVNDAMDLARHVGGAVLYHEGEWRCYGQINRLCLDFPHLKAEGALLREQVRCLRVEGKYTDEQIVAWMKDWYEKGQPIGEAGVLAVLKELGA
jgi:hypothetical protein